MLQAAVAVVVVDPVALGRPLLAPRSSQRATLTLIATLSPLTLPISLDLFLYHLCLGAHLLGLGLALCPWPKAVADHHKLSF